MKNNQKRLAILDYSLDLEWLTSKQLSRLLKIDNHKDSISFGETGQSLSFNQKINLLMDSRDIDKANKPFFQTFMEIRNKFIHNNDINTFLEACESSNKVNFLKKHFEEDLMHSDIEVFLENAIYKLFRKCITLLIEIDGLITEYEKNDSELDLLKMRFDTLYLSVKGSLDILSNQLQPGKNYSTEEVKNILEEFRGRLNLKIINEGIAYVEKIKAHNNS